jgi:hypothetical protein
LRASFFAVYPHSGSFRLGYSVVGERISCTTSLIAGLFEIMFLLRITFSHNVLGRAFLIQPISMRL